MTAPPPPPSPSPAPPLHPEIAHLSFLLGTWIGSGDGRYPTIESFRFTERTEFGHVGKPFLTFVQRTRDADGAPLHTEAGYLRPVGTDRVEFVITMPSGIMESLEGELTSAQALTLASTTVLCTATAKEVTATAREYRVEGDTLRWRFSMAAVGQEMQHHLSGELTRAPD